MHVVIMKQEGAYFLNNNKIHTHVYYKEVYRYFMADNLILVTRTRLLTLGQIVTLNFRKFIWLLYRYMCVLVTKNNI